MYEVNVKLDFTGHTLNAMLFLCYMIPETDVHETIS